VALGAAPDPWAGTHDFAPPNFPYHPQGEYYCATIAFTDNTQGGYPSDAIFQPYGPNLLGYLYTLTTLIRVSHANQHESEQPAMNQDGLYGHNNVFSDHDGT
jgi:hypothetical protein